MVRQYRSLIGQGERTIATCSLHTKIGLAKYKQQMRDRYYIMITTRVKIKGQTKPALNDS